MKMMKSIFAATFALFAITAVAQEEGKVEKKESKKERLAEELSLSEEQSKQMEEAFEVMIAQKKELKANTSLSEEERKAEMKKIRDEHHTAIESILDEEQLEKFNAMKDERKEKMQSPEMRAKRQTKEMTDKLGLNEAQAEEVYELNLKVAEKIDAIRNDESMDAKKKRAFVKGNLDDKRKTLSSILTEEQLAQYDEMMAERKHAAKERHKQKNDQ